MLSCNPGGNHLETQPRASFALMDSLNSGDTAWLLVSSALVLLMSPALALFYGGLVRRKNVLSTIMHSLAAIPLLSIKWALWGYSVAFGTTHGGIIGGTEFLGLTGLASEVKGTVPALAFVSFQMMFAIITPALISGAFAERMKFSSYLVFALLWSTFVYDPVAHWVWAEGGWLLKMGALDFAGGTVVHLTAGIAALVCALVLGPRKHRGLPHNLTMTILGAGLLWFGWFGFNAGSALSAGGLASLAFIVTHLGAAGGGLGWLMLEWKHAGKPTALGVASGVVAGLVAITPAAGFVSPMSAICIGLAAGCACYGAILLKARMGYDDALDAFGVHGIGGLVGAVLTGVFASKAVNAAGADGLLSGGGHLLFVQVVACAAAGVYAALMTWIILKAIERTMGLRVGSGDEDEGLDAALHGEDGYAGLRGGEGSSHLARQGLAEPEAPAQAAAAGLGFVANG